MGANQIANMVMKIFMRKAISKGMDMGFSAVSKQGGGNRRAQQQQIHDDMDYDSEVPQKRQLTPEEKRQRQEVRRARRAARQAKQAMKVSGRATRM